MVPSQSFWPFSSQFVLRVLSRVESSGSCVDWGITALLQDNCLLQILGPASHFLNPVLFIEFIEAGVGVGLQCTAKLLQMP